MADCVVASDEAQSDDVREMVIVIRLVTVRCTNGNAMCESHVGRTAAVCDWKSDDDWEAEQVNSLAPALVCDGWA